jgi:probable phosphoglycerate mutase
VREGEPQPMRDGHGDPPLDPVGEAQAIEVAKRLAGEPISAIYVTTLQRTVQTAAPLAEQLGLEPRVEADLREVFLGEWEGGAFRKYVDEAGPTAMRMLTEERWDVIPGAESTETLQDRLRAAIGRIAAAHPDELVVAFVHGGVVGQILATATGSRPFAFVGADNGSISQIVVDGDRWHLRRYNDTTHLHPRFTVAAEPLT